MDGLGKNKRAKMKQLPFKDLFDKIEPLTRKGAFGKAFRCEKDGKITVVKLLYVNSIDNEYEYTEAVNRFQKEICVLQQIEHDNIVRILRVNEKEPPFWYEMEYADFGDLEETMLYYSRDPIVIRAIFLEVCCGVKFLHQRNIIHRDLKPRNILLFSHDGKPSVSAYYNMTAKIADLGLVLTNLDRVTESNIPLGTIEYMAPEQKSNAKYVTGTADIYSLGKILLEMWTGNTDPSFIDQVPKQFRQIIKKSTKYESDERHQSIDELVNDLYAVSTDELFSLGYIHPGREFENIINHQYYPSENITPQLLKSLAELLERAKDSDPGFVVVNTANIPIKMIEKIATQKPNYIKHLLVRFTKAMDSDYDKKFWSESQESFIYFLGRVHMVLSYKGNEESREICFNKICWYAQEKDNSYAKVVLRYLIKKASTSNDKQLIKAIVERYTLLRQWFLIEFPSFDENEL